MTERTNERARQINAAMSAVRAASDICDISVHAILSPCRGAEYVYPRSLAYYVSREYLHIPYLAIAAAMQRHHTTVLHGVRKIKHMIDSDPFTKCDVTIMCERLKHLRDAA